MTTPAALPDTDASTTTWVKARACDSSSCLEVARMSAGAVLLRSSVTRRAIMLTEEEWRAAVADIQAGGFGNLANV